MSAHLTWMIIRNNNAYLLKKRNVRKPFSTEPNNLTNLSSFRYSGLIHKKSVGVVAAPDNKGFTVVYKKSKASVSWHMRSYLECWYGENYVVLVQVGACPGVVTIWRLVQQAICASGK
jgi:hypothetical protein